MGEISDMIMEGNICQGCGMFIEGKLITEEAACGHPRFCEGCGGDPDCNGAAKKPKRLKRRKRKLNGGRNKLNP